ncbi:Wadjet anti-phage system protein JetD domain-containing protein [Brevibacterium sp. 'Marine']|uniref:Wadjet anti-phage system protein JetD domain-containing protein n=1 Tax=Brevibacterium sp. 'Marine' TaxID=2725563 RepID=UPI00145C4196|nr:Wadjet anti-phage system protein JetD domain-containing protein [Brevibacterium sp. 'Marine']
MTMLSVAEARAKARKRLTSSMAAWAAEHVEEVRVEIALHPPTEKQVLTDQAAAANWAANWRALEGKAGDTAGFTIDWDDRNWTRVGRQQVPVRLRLTTPAEVAAFVGGDTARDWRILRDRAQLIRERLGPASNGTEAIGDADAEADEDKTSLAAAIRSQAKRILSLSAPVFATVVDVVDWLGAHRLGSLRPRQLPIRGVDSKWFETHRSLVTALLTGIGRPDAVTVLDAEPRLRMRILDPRLLDVPLEDITAPISQLGRLPVSPRLVFVFENLESVLAMPEWPGAVAVHGSGYAVDGVARLDWVAGARVIYWGDLDSHGFAILNRLRSHLPKVESVLMDEATLLAHADLWVPEPTPTTGAFSTLTGTEARAFERLRAEGSVRLEQERIPWDTALNRLRTAAGAGTSGRLGGGADVDVVCSPLDPHRLGEVTDDDR